MSKRLFVGGLPYEMTDEKLQELFSQCGRVEKVKVMFDRATGRSKGFGFIEMATDLEGNAAILKFDGSTLGSRSISVKEAKPAEDRKREGGSGGRPNDNRPRENRPSSGPGNNRGGGFGDQRGPRSGGFSKPAGSAGTAVPTTVAVTAVPAVHRTGVSAGPAADRVNGVIKELPATGAANWVWE